MGFLTSLHPGGATDRELNFHQLFLFYTVARHRSFSRAAQELGVSQPAVSIQVQELEKSLGTPLFHRRPRELQLTDVGETVYHYVQRIFSLATEMQEAIQDLQGLKRGHLTLGASTTPGEFLLPLAIGRFRQRHPGIEVELLISNTRVTVERVMRRELDLGVVGDRVQEGAEELVMAPYVTDEIILIASPNHPLAQKGRTSPQEVAQEGLVVREVGSATRRAAERCFAYLGVTPRIIMELGSNQAVKQAAAAGLGVGVISRYGVAAELKAGLLRVLNVEGWACTRPLTLIYLRDRHLSSVQRAFLQFLEEEKPLPPTPLES